MLLLGGALVATAGLVVEPAKPTPAPAKRGEVGRGAVVREVTDSNGSASIDVRSEAALEASGRAALASIARRTTLRVAATNAAARLEAELLATPANADKVGLRVSLERLLRERPELAPGAARAFAKLEDRETLFVVSRALVACLDRPEVRAALDEAAASGPEARREVALIALPTDARSLALARRGLDDASAPATVRAASAYALARGFTQLGDDEQTAALATARALGAAPGADAHLRAEALHLVARGGGTADAALAAGVLDETSASPELALAAAHLALASGSTAADVAQRLARNPSRACALAAATLTSPRRDP